jgi:hypothetical protein
MIVVGMLCRDLASAHHLWPAHPATYPRCSRFVQRLVQVSPLFSISQPMMLLLCFFLGFRKLLLCTRQWHGLSFCFCWLYITKKTKIKKKVLRSSAFEFFNSQNLTKNLRKNCQISIHGSSMLAKKNRTMFYISTFKFSL